MRLLAASDDNGSLKEITCIRGTDTSVQSAPQPEKIETFHPEGLKKRVQKFILVTPTESEERFVIAARANGSISIYKENATYDLVHTLSDNLAKEDDQFVALVESFGIIIAVSEQAKLTLINLNSILTENVETNTVSLTAPLSAFAPHPEQRGVYAYGGKENDVKIIRLFKEKETLKKIFKLTLKSEQLFQGKNVKNDKLDLRVPIWITKILFVELSNHTEKSWRFITTTRYGQVRKYDTSHGRKPLFNKKLSDKPLHSVTTTPYESQIICSDTHATTALFDIEKGTLVGKYKGSVGAVQDLYSYLADEESLLVTGALDRYLRVFDINSKEQVSKVFVGSKVSAVWLLDPVDNIIEEPKVEDNKKKARKPIKRITDEEEDALWNKLEGNDSSNKKRKTK